jgi:hypothetical protein
MISTETVTASQRPGSKLQASMRNGNTYPCWNRGNIHAGCCQSSIISRSLARYLDRHPLLRRLLFECRSFLHRSRIALRNTDIYRLSTGPVYLDSPEGHTYSNIRSLARIQHIKSIVSTLSWATPIEWKTHLESWEQGVEWAVCNLGSGSSLPDEHKALLASELAYQRHELS